MGRDGCGAYEKMHALHGDTVVGIDFDEDKIKVHESEGRIVLHGDPSDADFWDKIKRTHKVELVMLALPNLQSCLDVLEQMKDIDFKGKIATTARYKDEVEILEKAGATAVFNMYTEAGFGFANHVEEQVKNKEEG